MTAQFGIRGTLTCELALSAVQPSCGQTAGDVNLQAPAMIGLASTRNRSRDRFRGRLLCRLVLSWILGSIVCHGGWARRLEIGKMKSIGCGSVVLVERPD